MTSSPFCASSLCCDLGLLGSFVVLFFAIDSLSVDADDGVMKCLFSLATSRQPGTS